MNIVSGDARVLDKRYKQIELNNIKKNYAAAVADNPRRAAILDRRIKELEAAIAEADQPRPKTKLYDIPPLAPE